jgi:hypothetical protein
VAASSVTAASGAEKPQGGQAQSSQAATEQATGLLKEMSKTLASAKTLHFKTRSLVPFKSASGDYVTIIGASDVMREGKDKLAIETGGDLFPYRLYFDGKTVTAFAQKDNVYAQREAPGTIDTLMEQAAKKGGVPMFVFADLVSADPYAAMAKGLQRAMIVGTSTVDGVETRHVAVHGKQLNWEMWIGTEDHLPRLLTLTDKNDANRPTYTLLLQGWEVDKSLPENAFAFQAPPDAMKVPFRDPGEVRKNVQARRGGTK